MSIAFRLDYVDGAATTRRSVIRRDGTLFTDRASNYEPPDNGIHLCGVTDDGLQPTTVAVYRASANRALIMFELAKAVAECSREEADFIVDLCRHGSIDLDFHTNRQIWPRAIEKWNDELQE